MFSDNLRSLQSQSGVHFVMNTAVEQFVPVELQSK